MSRNVAFRSNFAAGELSPLLHWRTDYQRNQTGVRRANGFLPLREGGLMRAPGTVFWDFTLAGEDGDLPVRLIPFEFNAADAVILEVYPGVLRVRRYGALVMDGPDVYQLEHPYDAAAIARLSWVQSADVIYLADGVLPIHKLSRFALDNWTIAPLAIDSGPFRPVNTERAQQITASAATGTVTLSANFDAFLPGHVGGLLRLEAESWPGVAMFHTHDNSPVGKRLRNDNKVYAQAEGDDTGYVPPVHDHGIERTSEKPVAAFEFISTLSGVVRITAVTSPTSATATVIRRLPEPTRLTATTYATAPTYRWAFGAWSEVYGYPAQLALYDQRMFAARTATEPRTLWASATGGGYLDFEEGESEDTAFSLIIDGDGSLNPIQWLAAGARALHIGAQAEEYSLRSIGENTAVAVTNARIGRDSSKGSTAGRPVVPEGSPIFISRDRRRLFEITYVIEYDANIARELSLPVRHFGADRFAQVVHQGAPLSMTWVRRDGGDLLALSYDKGEDVQGWARLTLAGGVVEDMAVTRAVSDDASILVLSVRRQIDGATRRCIEALASPPAWDFIPAGDVPATHFFCAAVFSPTEPAASFALPHLAGETVQVWADAQDLGAIDVAGDGTLTLPWPVSQCEAGLFDAAHEVEMLDIGSAGEGSVPGAPRRVEQLPAVHVFATQQGRIQTIARRPGADPRVSTPVFLLPQPVVAGPMTPQTCAVKPELAGGFESEVSLRITPFSGASLTVLSVTAILQKGAA